MPELKAREGLIDFYFIEAQEPEAIQDLIVRLVKERIPARFGWTFRIGDRVIQTENDYNRDVFNGDLGVIEKINRIEQEMAVNFEGRQVEYDLGGPGRHEEGPVDGGTTVFWGLVYLNGEPPSKKKVEIALREAGFDFAHNVLTQMADVQTDHSG